MFSIVSLLLNLMQSVVTLTIPWHFTIIAQGIYEQCTYSTRYAIVDQAVSRMTRINEYDANLHDSHYEVAASMKEEQNIYDTPCDDEEDYGPIYYEPPNEEEKIYAVFAGRKLQKLYREDVRYVCT